MNVTRSSENSKHDSIVAFHANTVPIYREVLCPEKLRVDFPLMTSIGPNCVAKSGLIYRFR